MARGTKMGGEAGAPARPTVNYDVSLLTDQDLHLFNEGTHYRLYEKLGAHRMQANGVEGTHFAVWAPNARHVCVMGDFNGWNKSELHLGPRGHSGIWEGFIPGVEKGAHYKYSIESHHRGFRGEKTDPFAIFCETPPKTASIVWDLDYIWDDADWMRTREDRNALRSPMTVYEVHLGSWMRVREEGNRSLSYREMAPRLAEYVLRMGFTHAEFLPVMEHPFYGSWGYQCTGFFAPTSRYGTPQDFMYLVDYLHQRGIAVILDWVPSHFPTDGHGLSYFDGTHLYEHEDPRQGLHQDWGSLVFNYGRNEVRSFLMSSATYWLDKFHADGLRVDAVASMLYLDYSRKEGQWVPNRFGGRENIEAIEFLRTFNQAVYREHPEVQTIAEESTSWPMVSRPVYLGGLGFGLKWDMGWMHDTLKYMAHDPIHRKFHHNLLTFRMLYAYHENFMLPLSHDEVVHGKGSLLNKMPGDEWQKFANLRLLFANMFFHAGKKLIFMGGEFGQWQEWNHDTSLEWSALDYHLHAGVQQWVADLNRFYCTEPAMHELDCDPDGFEWVDCNDSDNSILTLLRKGTNEDDVVLVACNFTPVARSKYRVGVDRGGYWREALNSDAVQYGGTGWGNMGGVEAQPTPYHGRSHSVLLTLPPLSAVFFKAPSAT
jgi:1,4-alpha-glucan branching enzyme